MKSPFVRRSNRYSPSRREERGVTIVLVALTMVAIMAMAALSIDVVTLYLASAEAQRSADEAALAGARILSITGMTGDPNNSGNTWPQACDFAAKVATAVAEQDIVGGTAPTGAGQITVTFPNNSDPTTCTGSTRAFGVNPLVTVKVQNTSLPTFFARIWGQTGATVSATATAEAFNSSNSDSIGASGTVTPVQPRCVKPWIVPNRDPGNAGTCAGSHCPHFVADLDGSIQNAGIMVNYAGTGIVGRTFNLFAGCSNTTEPCVPITTSIANNSTVGVGVPNLEYLPGEVPVTSSAVPACATGTQYEEAVAGCDQTTVYQCGVQNSASPNPNLVDLSENPGGVLGDTSVATQCLIGQGAGQDTLDVTAYPYHIKAGAGNPLVTNGSINSGSIITSSNSVVSLPIYDDKGTTIGPGTTPVTIVGFLQVFINSVDAVNAPSSVNVTVINVIGCGDGTRAVGTAVSGTSPVPVRLITYP
jgi:Flp pilus assembly protein TadG